MPGTLSRAPFPICGVHLHWLAGARPPACGERTLKLPVTGAKDEMWKASQALLSLKRTLST